MVREASIGQTGVWVLKSGNWPTIAEIHERKALETSDPVYQRLLLEAARQWRNVTPDGATHCSSPDGQLVADAPRPPGRFRIPANVMNFFRLF